MPTWTSALNFPIFFYAALKNNIALSQQDAVCILLVGIPYTKSDSSQKIIQPSIISGYINGTKPIAKDTCLEYIHLSSEERMNRLKDIGISMPGAAVNALVFLLQNSYITIDASTKNRLLSIPYSTEPLFFLNEVLYEAIKSNNNGLFRPSNETKTEIQSFRSVTPTINSTELYTDAKKQPPDVARLVKNTPAINSQASNKATPNIDYKERQGRCINDDKKDYYILDEYGDEDYLASAPSEYIANFLYYITLSYSNTIDNGGRKTKYYLLLTHDRYMGGNDLWSVPFYSYSIESGSGMNRPKTVKMIREYFNQRLPLLQKEIQAGANLLLFHLSVLSGHTVTEGDTFIEYKSSPSQPDRWKCYYVKEYFINNIDPSDIINLTDPCNLRGYKYFPLTDWEESGENIPWVKKDGMKLRFPGGYIPENIVKNIVDQRKPKYFAIQVSQNTLYRTGSGFLFRLEIPRYTLGLLHSINFESQQDSVGYRIKQIFESSLLTAGIDAYTIYEESFTAWVLSKRSYDVFISVINLMESIYSQLCNMNPHPKKKLSVLCYVHYSDNIQYGKEHGLHQSTPCFFGSAANRLYSMAYVTTTRLSEEISNTNVAQETAKDKGGFFNKMFDIVFDSYVLGQTKHQGLVIVLDEPARIISRVLKKYNCIGNIITQDGGDICVMQKKMNNR